LEIFVENDKIKKEEVKMINSDFHFFVDIDSTIILDRFKKSYVSKSVFQSSYVYLCPKRFCNFERQGKSKNSIASLNLEWY